MVFKTHIRTHEVGLRFRRNELHKILMPGRHIKFPGNVDQVFNRLDVEFSHDLLEVLTQNAELRALLHVVDLGDTQRALVFKKGRLLHMLTPGNYAFWKQAEDLVIETYDVNEFRFEHVDLDRILANPAAGKRLGAIRTDKHEQVLIYRNGKLVEQFGPGTYAYWLGTGHVTFEEIDLREQTLDVGGQEIMTADKVTLRVNLVVTFCITNALLSVTVVDGAAQAVYREAQLALRAAVGTRTLDQLLADRDAVANEVRAATETRAAECGMTIRGAGIRDVILPGEMKAILNQVIEAEKQAEANLIRRREETAAARSQANTARLMAENPVLRRMRELEQLQHVLTGTKTTIVLGQGDITSQIRQMIQED